MPKTASTSDDASTRPVEYSRIGIASVLVKKTADQNSAPDGKRQAVGETHVRIVGKKAGI